MKKHLLFINLMVISLITFGQELPLDSCQAMARRNHPLLRQAGIIDDISALRQQNLSTLNLPQFDLAAKASWQSEVTKLPIHIPGIALPESLSKDQYKAYIDIRQKIYDGGIASRKKAVEEADRLVSRQQNETDLYKIKETVNSFYFNILVIDANNEILKLKRSTLNERIKMVGSAVESGVTLPNELDQLRAELLLTDQQQTELDAARSLAIGLLSIVIGKDLNGKEHFEVPDQEIKSRTESVRPEITLFELQKSKLDKNAALLKASRTPFVYAFGQAGYGRPGLNMLNNSFADWYIAGAGVSWNIFDWRKTKRDQSALKLQQELINTNLDQFNRSLNMSLLQEATNGDKLRKLIVADEQISQIKEQISRRSSSALENGTITSADYLRDLNASLQAKANTETHKIQLIQSNINYKTIQGK